MALPFRVDVGQDLNHLDAAIVPAERKPHPASDGLSSQAGAHAKGVADSPGAMSISAVEQDQSIIHDSGRYPARGAWVEQSGGAFPLRGHHAKLSESRSV
jgi:hypothetical protein